MRLRWLALFASLWLALPLAAETWTRSFTVKGEPTLHISADAASITVRAWSRREVRIRIVSHAWGGASARMQANAHQSGNLISLRVRKRNPFVFFGGANMRIVVESPSPARLALHSGDGSIALDGIVGELELSSGDGSIHARNAGGEVRAASGDGSIRLEGRFASLRAHSGNGSVHIDAQPGSQADSRWNLSSGDGSIFLHLPSGISANIDAHTGDGSIDNHLPLTLTRTADRHHLRGRLNQGGAVIRLSSGDGSIHID